MAFVHASTSEELSKIKDTENLVVVKYTASWCGPCKAIQPKLDTLAAENKDVLFCSVDVDAAEANGWTIDGVDSLPTFHFVRDGIQLNEIKGANFEKIVSSIQELK